MKQFRNLTDIEKGALLLARHNGEVIECFSDSDDGWRSTAPCWVGEICYRVKPKPFYNIQYLADPDEGLVMFVEIKALRDAIKMIDSGVTLEDELKALRGLVE
jgi:hypothetical protein